MQILLQLDPNAVVDADEQKTQAYDNLHKNMVAMQLAVNNVLDRDLSKIDTGNRPGGVRQVST